MLKLDTKFKFVFLYSFVYNVFFIGRYYRISDLPSLPLWQRLFSPESSYKFINPFRNIVSPLCLGPILTSFSPNFHVRCHLQCYFHRQIQYISLSSSRRISSLLSSSKKLDFRRITSSSPTRSSRYC